MPEGPPLAWLVAILGLYVVLAPFVFGFTDTYQTSLLVVGILVTALAAWRGWQPDEKIPLPFLPLAVILLGLYTIATPFLFGNGIGDSAGISLVIAGLVFIVVPAMMINQMINDQQGAPA